MAFHKAALRPRMGKVSAHPRKQVVPHLGKRINPRQADQSGQKGIKPARHTPPHGTKSFNPNKKTPFRIHGVHQRHEFLPRAAVRYRVKIRLADIDKIQLPSISPTPVAIHLPGANGAVPVIKNGQRIFRSYFTRHRSLPCKPSPQQHTKL